MSQHELSIPYSQLIVVDDLVLEGRGGDPRLWSQVRAVEATFGVPITEIYPENAAIKGNSDPEDTLVRSANPNSLVIARGPGAIDIAVRGILRANQGATLLALKNPSFPFRCHDQDLAVPHPRGHSGIVRLLQHLEWSQSNENEAHYIVKQGRTITVKALAELCLPASLKSDAMALGDSDLPLSA